MKWKNITSRFPLIWKAGIASADQALLSALSFFVSIFLIKNVPKSEFGYYSIAMAVLLFLTSVQNAVVNTPLAVLLVTKKDVGKRNYVASLCYGQFLAALPLVCGALVAITTMKRFGFDATKLSIGATLCTAVAGLLFWEFMRSYLFAEQMPLDVLMMDILYVAIFIGISVMTVLFWRISAAAVFAQMGISGLLVSLFYSRNRNWKFQQQYIRESYRENWVFGKWALLGVCVTHAQNYSYLYLLGAISGSMAVADVSAARLLLMPMMLIQIGWGKIAIPHGATMREEGNIHRFFKEQILSSLVFFLAVAAYVTLVLAFSGELEKYLLSEKYSNSFQYVVIWGAIFVAGFAAINASYGLQVMMEFRTITKISFFIMLVTVGSAYFLIQRYGIAGGLAALLLGQILLAVGLWIPFGKNVISLQKKQKAALMEKDGSLKLSENPP